MDDQPPEPNNNNSGGKPAKKKARVSNTQSNAMLSEATVFACDSCLRYPLETIRHRCTVCTEYDLCDDCFKAKKHSQHTLLPIAIVKSTSAQAVEAAPTMPIQTQRRNSMLAGTVVGRMHQLLEKVKVQIPQSHFNVKAGEEFLGIFNQCLPALKSSRSSVPAEVFEQILVRTAVAQVGSKAKRTADTITFAHEPEPACLFTLMYGFMLQLLACSVTPKDPLLALKFEMDQDDYEQTFESFFENVRQVLNDHKYALSLLGLGELRDAIEVPAAVIEGSVAPVSDLAGMQDLQEMELKLVAMGCGVPMRDRSAAFAKRFLTFLSGDDQPKELLRTAVFLAGSKPYTLVAATAAADTPRTFTSEEQDSIISAFLDQMKPFAVEQRLEVAKKTYFEERKMPQDFFCKCVRKVLSEIPDQAQQESCVWAWQDLMRSIGITIELEPAAATALVEQQPVEQLPVAAPAAVAPFPPAAAAVAAAPAPVPVMRAMQPPAKSQASTKKKTTPIPRTSEPKERATAGSLVVPPPAYPPPGMVNAAAAAAAPTPSPPPQATTTTTMTTTTMMEPISQPSTMEEANEMRALVAKLKGDLEDAHARIDMLAVLLRDKLASPLMRALDKVGRN